MAICRSPFFLGEIDTQIKKAEKNHRNLLSFNKNIKYYTIILPQNRLNFKSCNDIATGVESIILLK